MKAILSYNHLKRQYFSVLVLLFLIHGGVYYLEPETIYLESSPFKLIKYVIVLIALLYIKIDAKKFIFFIVITSIFLLGALGTGISAVTKQLVLYIIPVFVVFIYSEIRSIKTDFVVPVIILVLLVYVIIELFILNKPFYQFDRSGDSYRVVAGMVNPNNFGVFASLIYSWVSFNVKNKLKLTLFFLIFFAFIVFSGSKTAIVLFAITNLIFILNVYYGWLKQRNLFKLLVGSLFLVSLIVTTLILVIQSQSLFQLRSFSLISLLVRIKDYGHLITQTIALNPLFPGRIEVINVDNIYLHIWSHFGIFSMIAIIFLFVSLFSKAIYNLEMFTYVLLFCVLGFTTNFLYLWPLGYIFWYLTFYIIFNESYFAKNIE